MELTWLNPDHLAERDVAGAVAVLEAAREVDCPHQLSPTVSSFTARLQHGWDGDPPVAALHRDGRGRVVGVLELTLPHWDNTYTGWVEVTVDPASRGRGIGRQMFESGVDRVRAAGRTLLLSDTYEHAAGVGFLKALGLDRASEAVQRRQDLVNVDRPGLDVAYADAESHAGDYDLLHLEGATPEELLADVVAMTAAINDAPIDDLDIEDEVFSPERIRAFEAAQRAHGRRTYRLVARERRTGGLAGHTQVAVEANRPWYGAQFDTSVLRSHRGHRLGLLLKIAMVRWLADAEPQLRLLDTWNAASNAHMIRVNEALGYQVVATASEWQRHL
ncbi:MAG TPA: GNAT family N-acetyltransferase [Jiangellaceae bacterium]|nr:GNAT family N-acetyltransferase [Jiangellaceae bacterium]